MGFLKFLILYYRLIGNILSEIKYSMANVQFMQININEIHIK